MYTPLPINKYHAFSLAPANDLSLGAVMSNNIRLLMFGLGFVSISKNSFFN